MKLSEIQGLAEVLASHSRYDRAHFLASYWPEISKSLEVPNCPADSWIGVACLPASAVRDVVTSREDVTPVGCLGVGVTRTGRSLVADLPCCMGGTNNELHPSARQDPREDAQFVNRDTWVRDTWVLVITDKNPNLSTFTTDRDMFGLAKWTVVHQPAAHDPSGIVPVLPVDFAVMDDMRK